VVDASNTIKLWQTPAKPPLHMLYMKKEKQRKVTYTVKRGMNLRQLHKRKEDLSSSEVKLDVPHEFGMIRKLCLNKNNI